MTPAIHVVKRAKVFHRLHEYEHEASSTAYGKEAAQKLGIPEDRIFKTLVVSLDAGGLAVAVVPVASMLNMKLMAKAAGAKKAGMAPKADVERVTGYVLGGVSPLGQKKRLRTVIDASAQAHETVLVSARRRGLQIELRPDDLRALTDGLYAEIGQSDHGQHGWTKPLRGRRAPSDPVCPSLMCCNLTASGNR